MNKFLTLFLFSSCFSFTAFDQVPQRLSYTSYTVAEGLVSNLVNDIALDANGFLWVSTTTGLQRFDGKTFYTIPQRNDSRGIHYDKKVNFMPLQNGELLIATPMGIAFYNPVTNRFRNVLISSLKSNNPEESSLVPLKEEANNIWLMNDKKIFEVDKVSGAIQSEISIPVDNISNSGGSIQSQIDKQKIFILINRNTFLVLDTKIKKLEDGHKTNNYSIDHFHILNGDTLLLTTAIGMQKINIHTSKTLAFCPFPGGQENTDYSQTSSLQLSPAVFLVGVNIQLWEFDAGHNIFTRPITDVHDHPFITANLYRKLIRDKYNNIWAASFIQGLRKIHYQPPAIKYFGAGEKENNFVKCIYADKKNDLVLCGMFNHGLQVYDTNQQLIKNIPQFENNIPQPTVAAIEKMNDHEYLLFPQHSSAIHIFNSKTLTLTKASPSLFPFHPTSFNYYLNFFHNSDSSFLGNVEDVIYRFTQTGQTIHADSLIGQPAIGSFYTFQHSNGDIWLGCMGKYSILQSATKTFSFFPIYDNVMIRCITEDKQHFVWLATEKGLYKVAADGKIIKQYNKKDGLPDEGIYAVITDIEGNIWFSHNKGLSRINSNGSILNLDKEDGLQENEFNSNCVFKTEDGELFFGGVNGVNSFSPSGIASSEQSVKLFLTSVSANGENIADTAYWNLSSLSTSYRRNALMFGLIAQGSRNADQYIYQYKIAGLHNKWMNNGNNSALSLLLSPGEYDLQLAAGDEFNENATTQKQIHIIIRPPFWQTTWFFISAALLLIALVWWLARFMARKKLREQLRQIETEKKLQQERERISRDLHDNLGAQATAIYYSAENIDGTQTDRELLGSIKTASQQMLSSLRETIWAMNKEEMSVADVSDRLKVFIMQLNRHYPGVKVHITENISGNTKLSSQQSLHLLRILQEAVNNAFKHALAKNIYCEISDAGDSITAIIKDDGIGIQKGDSDGLISSGDGLVNIQERAKAANMKLEIESANGKGTTIRIAASGFEN